MTTLFPSHRKHLLEEPSSLWCRKKTKSDTTNNTPFFISQGVSPRKRSLETSKDELYIIGKKQCIKDEAMEMESVDVIQGDIKKDDENRTSNNKSEEIEEEVAAFNNWNYWKIPLPKIQIKTTTSTPIEEEETQHIRITKRSRESETNHNNLCIKTKQMKLSIS